MIEHLHDPLQPLRKIVQEFCDERNIDYFRVLFSKTNQDHNYRNSLICFLRIERGLKETEIAKLVNVTPDFVKVVLQADEGFRIPSRQYV